MRLLVLGFAVMTNIKRGESNRCIGAAFCRQHGGHDRLGRIHVHNGWHADARRLDNVNDVDARAGLVWPGVVVSRNVGRDDDGDDDAIPGANAVSD